jgi:hypothetical protein
MSEFLKKAKDAAANAGDKAADMDKVKRESKEHRSTLFFERECPTCKG